VNMKKSLEEAYQSYEVLKGICDHAKDEAIRRPYEPIYGKIVLPVKDNGNTKEKKEFIKKYFDELQDIEELCALDIITAFEHKIFTQIDNAQGEIKKIIKDGYDKRAKKNQSAPFCIAASSFVKDTNDIWSLNGVKSLLGNKLGEDLTKKLADIIEHRNWLSHGKRTGVGKESCLTIKEIYKVLNDILDKTGNKISEYSASEEEI